jgi:hypothetical protein
MWQLGHANVQVDFSKYIKLSREETLDRIAYDLTSQKHEAETVQSRPAEEIDQAANKQSLLPWQ